MAAPETAGRIREANIRYHDAAAAEYDAKWGIDYGEIGRHQVLMKLEKALGRRAPRFERSLEIGAGTGYFTLHLLRAGLLGSAVCTDISPGMLATLAANARRLGVQVETVTAEAQHLPFAEGEFDLVLGHAVLHHLPDLPAAFREFHRVLEPGGSLVFAGEPSRYGDRLAAAPKRGARLAAPAWRRLIGARAAPGGAHLDPEDDHRFEREVDIHTFTPGELTDLAHGTGFTDVRVRGEELLANWFGWANRALEETADPADIPNLWRQYAFRGYIALQTVDRRVLEPRLPAGVFYNLMLAARRPVG